MLLIFAVKIYFIISAIKFIFKHYFGGRVTDDKSDDITKEDVAKNIKEIKTLLLLRTYPSKTELEIISKVDRLYKVSEIRKEDIDLKYLKYHRTFLIILKNLHELHYLNIYADENYFNKLNELIDYPYKDIIGGDIRDFLMKDIQDELETLNQIKQGRNSNKTLDEILDMQWNTFKE